ncbi:hypothetical protein GGR58DRAFT_5344 [Xylaria digitata]|nr:hypothetical protein GGR58DRAFT_5344 [Xylaria digitata]
MKRLLGYLKICNFPVFFIGYLVLFKHNVDLDWLGNTLLARLGNLLLAHTTNPLDKTLPPTHTFGSRIPSANITLQSYYKANFRTSTHFQLHIFNNSSSTGNVAEWLKRMTRNHIPSGSQRYDSRLGFTLQHCLREVPGSIPGQTLFFAGSTHYMLFVCPAEVICNNFQDKLSYGSLSAMLTFV